MKKNINLLRFLIFTLIVTGLTSCLENGLEELPAFEETQITNIFLEHRYQDPNDEWIDGSQVVKYKRMEVTSTTSGGTIEVDATVPGASGSFTEQERQKVSLGNMVVYLNISTAAKIEPLDGAPVLGAPGDYTQPRNYKVTAADGESTQIWTIKVNPLVF